MEGKRIARVSAWGVLVFCTLVLLVWALAGPMLRNIRPAPMLLVFPMMALSLIVAALGLAGAAAQWNAGFVRLAAILVLVAGVVVIAETAFNVTDGIETWISPGGAWDAATSWRPGLQSALGMLLFGCALLASEIRRSSTFDSGDIIVIAAAMLPFGSLLGYIFDVNELSPGASTVPPMAAFLQLVLAVGVMSLHPRRGLTSAFAAESTGAAAARRLLLWVVVLPVFFGWLQIQSIRYGLMDLPQALAATVASSILAFLMLIYWVSKLMSRLEAKQTAHYVERETQAKEEGMTDALTGLLNRRGWEMNLRIEEERCRSEGNNGCVVMIDLDDLKKVNDTQGHSQGDELIKRAAQGLKSGSRHGDILARLGGDEFAYLAVSCQPRHAGVVVGRLAASLQNLQVGASLGYAMRDMSGSLQGAFDEADKSMYANKRVRKAKRAALNF